MKQLRWPGLARSWMGTQIIWNPPEPTVTFGDVLEPHWHTVELIDTTVELPELPITEVNNKPPLNNPPPLEFKIWRENRDKH